MNYDLLDQKAIRIINRLAEHLSVCKKSFKEVFSDKILSTNEQADQNLEQISLDFIRSEDFFEKLRDLGLRKSNISHLPLIEFLSNDAKL